MRWTSCSAPLVIRLSDEARTWWSYRNGARSQPGDGSHATALSPACWWAPLEAVVPLCQKLRAMSDPDTWLASWLPIVVGSGELIIETSVTSRQPSPIHVIDFEGDVSRSERITFRRCHLSAHFVDTWTRAVSAGAVRFCPSWGTSISTSRSWTRWGFPMACCDRDRDSRANHSQALDFRCKLFPNSASIEVWLRNYSAPDCQGRLKEWAGGAGRKVGHLTRSAAGGAEARTAKCRTTGVNGIYSLMSQMQRRLIDGSIFAR